jgi:hypothetical protein
MAKKISKMDVSGVNKGGSGLDVICLSINGKALATYKGLGGTFAGFIDSCLRKRVLPGFHEQGLLAEALHQGTALVIRLSGKRSTKKLKEIMDVAFVNAGAYPDENNGAIFIIEVKSEK